MEEGDREMCEGGRVCGLIEKASNSTAPEVNPRLLKLIKYIVRDSETELSFAIQTLLSLMKRDHSQVRFLALLIIDELFMRSKLFRTLLVVNMDQLLTLSVGFRRNMPLPAPPAIATLLRSKAIEFLEKWNDSFGIHYRQLRFGYNYLKNTLQFKFPNLQANVAQIQQERRERQRKSKEILQNKFEMMKRNLPSMKNEIQTTIKEIEECLDIISTKDEEIPLCPINDSELVEFRNSELRKIRLDSLKEGEKICENSDNRAVFVALREAYKLLMTKHLVSVQQWISVLVRVEVADDRFRGTSLKEFIDIQNHLFAVKKKCHESGCDLPNTPNNEEDDDIWEEGKIEPIIQRESSNPISEQTLDSAIVSTSEVVKNKTASENNKSHLTSKNGKLFAEAPVMQWGLFLEYWGSNGDIPLNQRGLELDSHWGRVEYDAVIPAEKLAELNVQATFYKEEPIDIKPCHAPLIKGGLCERKDIRACPFHGPIIPRDSKGKPINEKISSMDSILPDSSTTSLVERIAKEAVKNVRDKDNVEAHKRGDEMKSFKRARLAKVREHNDAVLRDASMASSSRSEFDLEIVNGSGERVSNKQMKQNLASMVRKKVTAKDRIAQRLSNSRARAENLRQMTMGDDSKYREAFPNQW